MSPKLVLIGSKQRVFTLLAESLELVHVVSTSDWVFSIELL